MGLWIQRDESIMASRHGGQNRKLRVHILNSKLDIERNWRQGEASRSQTPILVANFL